MAERRGLFRRFFIDGEEIHGGEAWFVLVLTCLALIPVLFGLFTLIDWLVSRG